MNPLIREKMGMVFLILVMAIVIMIMMAMVPAVVRAAGHAEMLVVLESQGQTYEAVTQSQLREIDPPAPLFCQMVKKRLESYQKTLEEIKLVLEKNDVMDQHDLENYKALERKKQQDFDSLAQLGPDLVAEFSIKGWPQDVIEVMAAGDFAFRVESFFFNWAGRWSPHPISKSGILEIALDNEDEMIRVTLRPQMQTYCFNLHFLRMRVHISDEEPDRIFDGIFGGHDHGDNLFLIK